MKLYFAPMEGITSYTYRNTHNEMFGGCDVYFAPFISPSENERISEKHFRDILPENNSVDILIPQTLTNNADYVSMFEKQVGKIGYDTFNINLGCPSGTVVKKGKGAGFLRDVEGLNAFLNDIYSKKSMDISVKTRIGYTNGDEMKNLLELYNKYEISELTVHPRVREAMYTGVPDMEVFDYTYKESKNKLCYNGNIFTMTDYSKITGKYDNLESVMIGRGAISNPALFREIKGGEKLTTQELIDFSKVLIERYKKLLNSEVFTLRKLKEVWVYILWNFPEEKKLEKRIKKSNNLNDFIDAISKLPQIKNTN